MGVPDAGQIEKIEQFKGGQSNPTYKIITKGKNLVLRRKPPGKLLPSAHAQATPLFATNKTLC